MRKLFLLLPALVLSLFANAKTINIAPGTSLAYTVNDAEPGDVIVMADGLYPGEDQIKFVKDITIKAAEGATPVVQTTYYCELKSSAKVFIEGITFDGSSTTQQFIRTYDATAGKELHLNKCEFKNYPKDVISGDKAEYTLDSCVVTNCYFHSNNYSPIYFNKSSVEGQQTIYGLIVKNSTFANNDPSKEYRALIDVQSYDRSATDDIEVIVDHCTFYNNTVINYDYSAIRTRIVNRTTVLNCIFAHPSAQDWYATNVWAGSVTNCLAYNFNNGYNAPTKTEANTGNPLFADAANGDFSLAGDWTTTPMSLSPARGAATDGSDLGDPRWYSAEVLPETDFASPYVLTGDKAKLTGKVAIDASNYLQFNNNSDASQHGVAIWKVRATRSCNLQTTLNIDAENTSGHRYQIEVFDSSNTLIGTAIGESANSWDKGDKVISDLIMLSEAGDYKIKLSNLCNNSSNLLHSITLTYLGGAVIPVSPSANTTLNIADALFSGCTRDADYIQFPSSGTSSAWIKWNISTSETAFYDLTLNIDAPNAHGLTVEVFENEAEPAVATVTEGTFVETTGVLALALGRINLVGGKNYIVKVTNAPSGSTAKITSLIFAPVVSSTINLPDVLPFNQAVLSANAHVTDGNLYFAPIGDTNPLGEWAQWAVATDHDGLFLFTMNVNSDNGQSYRISIKDDAENPIDSYENNPHSGSQTITHYFALPAGNYFIKVENTTYYSHGYLVSFEVTESPNSLFISENATDNSAWASKVNDENTYDVQIIRTLRAGMYNTFCLPFAVSYSQCKAVFGNDVEIYTLGEATVEGEVLNVSLNNSTDIYQGTPVFIKPYTDIVNPIFTGVQFKRATPSPTTKTNADFVGTFIQTTLSANTDILYLGPDNTLYYPEVETPIKGFRAWFTIHDAPSPAPAIRRMNIVRNPGEATSINLINETKNNGKRIENGQLIIIRDGIRYNAMGIMIK